MRTKLLITVAILGLCHGAAIAQIADAPDRILPPPPAAGSTRAQAELDELKRIQAASTPEQREAAAYDDRHEDGSIFVGLLGPAFNLAKLPATVKLLALVGEAESKASDPAKAFFHRNRPWIVDPAIQTCTPHKPGPAATSYPSGHTTVGFAMAVVMANLIPSKSQSLMARATEFAENRLICGYHFRSDIVAGQTFGTVLALRLMEDASFRKQMDAARAELVAGQVIPPG